MAVTEKEIADARNHFWIEIVKLETSSRKTKEEIEEELAELPPHMWGNRR
jgi:hypothetical protein